MQSTNIVSRGSEISEYLREDMEERFQISCRQIQRMMEKNGEEIWAGLKRAIRGVSEKVLFYRTAAKKPRSDIWHSIS